MFNIGFSELLLVLLIAFLVVGPKDLPQVARWLGKAVNRIRTTLQEVKKESGWNELEEEINTVQIGARQSIQEINKEGNIIPQLQEEKKELEKNMDDIHKELLKAKSTVSK